MNPTFRYGVLCLLILWCSACSKSPQQKEADFIKRGQAQLAKKDYSRALLEFRNAGNVMPGDAEPYYQTGLVYLETRSLPEAVAAFRKATEADPKHTGAQIKLAELMTMSRDKEAVNQAADKLNELLKNAPDDPEIADYLAVAELRTGSPQDAANRLQDILKKKPGHLQTAFGLAQLKLRQKDLKGAEEVLTSALDSNPNSIEANLALAQFYVVTQKLDIAKVRVNRAIQLSPQNINALAMLAAIQIAEKRLDDADRTFKQIAALPDPKYRSMHAIFLAQTGKREEALAEFEKLAKAVPDDAKVRDRLVRLYVALNKTTEAQNLLNTAVKKNSKDIDALFQRSLVELRIGKTADAEASLKAILAISPNLPRVHFALAGLYRSLNRSVDERSELIESLHLEPNFVQARVELAHNYLASNDAKSALELLNQTPAAQRNVLPVVVERNWALLGTGNTKELKEVLARAPKTNPPPDLSLQDALVRLKDKDYIGARIAAQDVLRVRPTDARAALVLADSYGAQGDAPKGLQRLQEIASANPKSAALQQLLGDWYANAGKLAEARKAFESAKLDSAGFVQADLALARLDRREKRIDEARQRLTALVSADPKNISALIMLADLEEEAGNRAQALIRYKAAVALDPKNISALNNIAYETAVENPDEALKMASQAAELAPDDARIQDTLAWVFYKKGLYLQAEKYLKVALQKTPPKEPNAQYQYHLGKTYLKSGETAEGQKLLASALKQNPDLARTEANW